MDWIWESEVSNVPLYESDVHKILDTLCYDGRIELDGSSLTAGGNAVYKVLYCTEVCCVAVCVSLGDIWFMPTWWVLTFFLDFLNFWSDAPKFCARVCGGWGICIPFEICEKRLFQKCMSKGGGGCSPF